MSIYKSINHSNPKIRSLLKSILRLHPEEINLSLNRIKVLLNKLNNPHKKIKNIIHIAGTNGKGSIATVLYYLQKYQGKTVNIIGRHILFLLMKEYTLRTNRFQINIY